MAYISYYITITLFYLWWCVYDGKGDAFMFAISKQTELSRKTKNYTHDNIHELLFFRRVPMYLFVIGLSIIGQATYLVPIGIIILGDSVRNGSMRVEQGLSFFSGGHIWIHVFRFRCPNFLLKFNVVHGCMKSSNDLWIWEFKELNGYVKFWGSLVVYVVLQYFGFWRFV